MCTFAESKPMLDTILPALLGGFIAGLVGVWLANWQRKRDARNQFLVTMSLVKATMSKDMFVDFYRRSLPEIKEAVYRVLPFLRKSRADRLLSVWRSYAAIDDEEELPDRNEADPYRMALEIEKKPVPEKPSVLLTTYFDKLYKIVE
jgi:hypothetical protein